MSEIILPEGMVIISMREYEGLKAEREVFKKASDRLKRIHDKVMSKIPIVRKIVDYRNSHILFSSENNYMTSGKLVSAFELLEEITKINNGLNDNLLGKASQVRSLRCESENAKLETRILRSDLQEMNTKEFKAWKRRVGK